MPPQDPAAAIYAQMEATVRQMQSIRAEMKASFEYEFHNRPIEPWAGAIFDHFAQDVVDPADAVAINGSRKRLIKRVEDNLQLAMFAKYIHSHNPIQAHGFKIDDIDDRYFIKESIDIILARDLRAPFDLLRNNQYFSSIKKATKKWQNTIELLPKPEEVEFVEGTPTFITDASLDKIIRDLKKFLKRTKEIIAINEDYRINDFLRRVKDLGVPMTNAYYRDLYHCLEYFGLLNEGQINQHNVLNQPQVREQFIQKRIKRV